MLFATALALGAAALHTLWNLILKTAPAEDRDLTSWGIFLIGGIAVVPVVIARGGPGAVALPWLGLSALIHVGYVAGLISAYRDGDLSLAYPLLRGTGALTAAIGGALLLGDRMPVAAWLAIAIVVAGLVFLVGRGTDPGLIRSAVLTGLCIGAYTIADVHGARSSVDPISYGLLSTTGPAITLSALFLLRGRGPALLRALRRQGGRWTIGGLSTAVSYAMVLIAARHAEIGHVAVLRETSVVLGALAGWRLLGERLGGRRLVASFVVLAGMAALVLSRL